MANPYLPPESDPGHDTGTPPKTQAAAPLIGCGVGGCLLPTLLFIACAIFLGDTGGPLVWPILAVPLGVAGMVIGFICRAVRN